MNIDSLKRNRAYWLKTTDFMFHASRVTDIRSSNIIDVEGIAGSTKEISSTAVIAAFEKEITQEQLRLIKKLIGTKLFTHEGEYKIYDIYLMRRGNQETLVFTYYNSVGNLQGPFPVSEIKNGKKLTFRM